VYNEVAGVYDQIPSFNIGSSVNFGYVPSFDNFNWLLLVPVLTFVVYFASMKLTKKFAYQPVVNENQQAGCSGKIMDISMPLMSVFFSFMVPAVIGVYWMVKSVFSTLEQYILSRLMPLPKFTEEDYKAAEKELGVKNKKSGSKSQRDPNAPRPRSLHYIDDEDYEVSDNVASSEKAPEVKATETPVSAAPLKLDEPERKNKKAQKEEKAEEAEVEEAAEETVENAETAVEAETEASTEEKEEKN
jgi:membrane protein insertase Oxa1/YidC/SpoIIIJ